MELDERRDQGLAGEPDIIVVKAERTAERENDMSLDVYLEVSESVNVLPIPAVYIREEEKAIG